jgi:hypothetical protein
LDKILVAPQAVRGINCESTYGAIESLAQFDGLDRVMQAADELRAIFNLGELDRGIDGRFNHDLFSRLGWQLGKLLKIKSLVMQIFVEKGTR